MKRVHRSALWGLAAILLIVVAILIFRVNELPIPGAKPPKLDAPPQLNPLPPADISLPTVIIQQEEHPLSQGPDIVGTVQDYNGTPICGAAVQAIQANTGRHVDARSVTGEDGVYSLQGLHQADSLTYEVVASASDYATSSSGEFVFEHRPTEIDFRLSKGAIVYGRVSSETGEEVDGAVLYLTRDSKDFVNRGRRAITDSGGNYAFENVSAGDYTIYVYAKSYVDKERPLRIYPHEENTTLDFVLDHADDGYISGIIVNEEDEPIHNVRVEGFQRGVGNLLTGSVHRWTYTTPNGMFLLEGLSSDRFVRILTKKEGYKVHIQDEKPSGQELYIQLQSKSVANVLCSLSGRVIDDASEKPVSEFRIDMLATVIDPLDIQNIGRQETLVRSQMFNSPDGSFKITDLETADEEGPFYEIQVIAPGYAKKLVRGSHMRVFPGKNTSLGDIRLEPGLRLSGIVYDKYTSHPIPGAYVWAEHKPIQTRSRCYGGDTTDESGRYELTSVPDDMEYIFASHPGYSIAISDKIVVQDGMEQDNIDLFLTRGGTVEGKVTNGFIPIEGAKISIRPIDTPVWIPYQSEAVFPSRDTVSDSEGYYSFDNVSLGYCLVFGHIPSVESAHEVTTYEVIDIQDNNTTECNLTFCEGGKIRGTLPECTDCEDPTEIIPVSVYLRTAGAPPVDLNEDGTPLLYVPSVRNITTSFGKYYVFEEVCAGDYTLTAFYIIEKEEEKILHQVSYPVTINVGEETIVDITF